MQVKKLLMTGVIIATLTTSIMPVCAAPTATSTATPTPVVTLNANDKAVLKLLFDAEYYRTQYPDLAAAFGDNEEALFNHFCVCGINEGRSLSKDFNVAAYKSAYADLQEAFGDNVMAYYTHYVLTKDVENRVVTTVKKAQEQGITVTNFAGERVVESSDGKILTGKAAEKTIQRSKSHKSSSGSSSSSSSSSSNPTIDIADVYSKLIEAFDNALAYWVDYQDDQKFEDDLTVAHYNTSYEFYLSLKEVVYNYGDEEYIASWKEYYDNAVEEAGLTEEIENFGYINEISE